MEYSELMQLKYRLQKLQQHIFDADCGMDCDQTGKMAMANAIAAVGECIELVTGGE